MFYCNERSHVKVDLIIIPMANENDLHVKLDGL